MTLKLTISRWLSPKNRPSQQEQLILHTMQVEEDHILVRFSQPIEYLTLTPEQAFRWAEMLLYQAGTIRRDQKGTST